MNEIKILLQPEFEYYHSLLTAHGEDLVEKLKQTLFTAKYDDTSRILEFGAKSYFNTTITFEDDGKGKVTLLLPSTMTMESDGSGNVTIVGARFVDDGKGNVYIS